MYSIHVYFFREAGLVCCPFCDWHTSHTYPETALPSGPECVGLPVGCRMARLLLLWCWRWRRLVPSCENSEQRDTWPAPAGVWGDCRGGCVWSWSDDTSSRVASAEVSPSRPLLTAGIVHWAVLLPTGTVDHAHVFDVGSLRGRPISKWVSEWVNMNLHAAVALTKPLRNATAEQVKRTFRIPNNWIMQILRLWIPDCWTSRSAGTTTKCTATNTWYRSCADTCCAVAVRMRVA